MHRAVGRYQGWKFNGSMVGLSRNPWIHLSDGAGAYIQGISCAKNTPSRVKVKFFYPMEIVAFKPSIPLPIIDNARSNGERSRILSTASLQLRGNAKAKLRDRKSAGGRYLSSKMLMESAFQVLRDLRNEKFSMGLFRLGRSTPPDNSSLSSYPRERSGELEFQWSSALWEAEVSNSGENEVLSISGPVCTDINPPDKTLDSTSGTDKASRVSTALVYGAPHPSVNNTSETEDNNRTTAVASVSMELPNTSVYDNHSVDPQENKTEKEDAVEESRNTSDFRSVAGPGACTNYIEHTLEETVSSSGGELCEDSMLAYSEQTSGESIYKPNSPAVEVNGKSESQERMEKLRTLREVINHHAYRYYTLDDPTISDSAYDALMEEMKEVEASIVGVQDSRLPIVGAPPSSALNKVQHTVPMLSLASVQKERDLVLWHHRLQQRLGTERNSLQWVVEPKVDGLALSLRYENGKLVCASTRGNGLEGEDVTHNAQNVQNIPLVIPQQLPHSNALMSTLEVRGEIYIPSKDFEELNAVKLQSGERLFANPRNAAAGSMRLLPSQNLDRRPLRFVAYSIANIALTESLKGASESSRAIPSSQWEALQFVKYLGFFVNEDNQMFDSFDSALEYAKGWMNKRKSLGYEADGVVFKVNDLSTQAILGSIGGDPRWAVAWKFESTEVVTVLEAIELTVGRSGVIVPNARLKPVDLGGVSIRRATLHNFRHVKSLGLCEGDHVIVQRAGDVIPQVVQPLEELRPQGAHPWVPPTTCPSCGSELAEDPTKAMVFCQNPDCSSRRSRQVEHFAKSLISGLGPKVLTQLQEEGLVVDVADLYSLSEERLSNLPRLGKKSARTLLSAIEGSKGKPDWELIAALGIPRVGVITSQRLDEHFGGLRGLLGASDDELLNVPGVGEQTLKSVLDWCRCKRNTGLVSELLAAGCARASKQLDFRDKVHKSTETAVSADSAERNSSGGAANKQRETAAVERAAKDENSEGNRTAVDARSRETKLRGKIVVVTGSFEPFDRQYMHELVRSHGGQVRTSVTSKTSFVLAGANPGPKKIALCKQLGIDALDWEKFQNLIEEP